MKKSLKTKVRGLSKEAWEKLTEWCKASKDLYNQSLYHLRNVEHVSYNQLDKVMKVKENLEGAVNYRRLKAGVAQQTLRRLCSNYDNFFRALEDYKVNPSKYKGKPRSPKYQKRTRYNLIFDSQRFQVKEGWVWLDKAIPNMLQG